MPWSAPHSCQPGCPERVPAGSARCPKHTKQREAARRATDPSQALYNGPRWRAHRLAWLQSHPLCAECERGGRITPGTVCDHLEPHKGDLAKFWAGPFQSLCASCHGKKTATSDGGFGNVVVPAR